MTLPDDFSATFLGQHAASFLNELKNLQHCCLNFLGLALCVNIIVQKEFKS